VNSKASVLIDKDDRARLVDFGLTTIIRGNNSVPSLQDPNPAITTMWAAPEILGGGIATKERDIFTFAMVAIEVCTRGVFGGELLTVFTSNRHSWGALCPSRTMKPLCRLGSVLDDRRG
jgi:serine/threonine protein kinase